MKAALEIENLTVEIADKKILNGLVAHIRPGTISGLLGPSGAGKTTLIRSILGLIKPVSGQIKVLGLTAGSPSLHAKIGYVSQSPAIYEDLTVLENLEYFASLYGVHEEEIHRLIENVDLVPQMNQFARDLSGGEKARVSLVAALLNQPPVLLLDEPTVGLDPVLREKLWKMFRNLASNGATIVVTSHVMDEANKCDELLFIRSGELLAQGNQKDMLNRTNAKSMEAAFIALAEKEHNAR